MRLQKTRVVRYNKFNMTTAYTFCALITLVSSLVSCGFSVAAARFATGESRNSAYYAAARSIALVALCVVPVFNHVDVWLIAAAITMSTVQALDSIIGVINLDKMKTFGPAFLALINILALIFFIHSS